MFAYCGNNPITRKDSAGTAYVFWDEFLAEVDPDGQYDEGGGGGGYGLGVKPSYYTSQRVQAYDRNWQNSSYNQNPTSSGGFRNSSSSSVDYNSFSTGRTTPKNLTEKLAMESAKSDPASGDEIIKHLKDPRLNGFSKYAKVSAFTLAHLENARREIAVGNITAYQKHMGAAKELFFGVTEDGLLSLISGGYYEKIFQCIIEERRCKGNSIRIHDPPICGFLGC